MGELEDSVLGLLRSSEELRAVLETQLVSLVNPTLASPASRSRSAENYSSEDTRILAVVTHQDDWSVSEEGRCVPKYVFLRLRNLVQMRRLPLYRDRLFFTMLIIGISQLANRLAVRVIFITDSYFVFVCPVSLSANSIMLVTNYQRNSTYCASSLSQTIFR